VDLRLVDDGASVSSVGADLATWFDREAAIYLDPSRDCGAELDYLIEQARPILGEDKVPADVIPRWAGHRRLTRSGNGGGAGLCLLGLTAESIGLLLLVRDVTQALLQRGNFAEPPHPVGLVEPFTGVGLDLQQSRHLGKIQSEYGTPYAGLRCPMLRPDPGQAVRLAEIIANLHERIREATDRGWIGEVEGLRVSLDGARQKYQQMRRLRGQSTLLQIGSSPTAAHTG